MLEKPQLPIRVRLTLVRVTQAQVETEKQELPQAGGARQDRPPTHPAAADRGLPCLATLAVSSVYWKIHVLYNAEFHGNKQCLSPEFGTFHSGGFVSLLLSSLKPP